MSAADFARKLAEAKSIKLALTKDAIDDLACLAYHLAQERALRRSAVLTAKAARPYATLDDNERAGMRNAVRDIVSALVVEGYLEGEVAGG